MANDTTQRRPRAGRRQTQSPTLFDAPGDDSYRRSEPGHTDAKRTAGARAGDGERPSRAPVIKKTAHMKQRPLIAAAAREPSLPLFDAPEAGDEPAAKGASAARGASAADSAEPASRPPSASKAPTTSGTVAAMGGSAAGRTAAASEAAASQGTLLGTQSASGRSTAKGTRASGKSEAKRTSAGGQLASEALAKMSGTVGQKTKGPQRDEPAPETADESPAPDVPDAEAAPERSGRARETAVTLATKQREISISEFFTKNRHLLGFDNPQKSLLTAVKEAVDNALDACEEAGILPSLEIAITELAEDRYRVRVVDNGPGIVRQQIPRIFGKLLYGSKFHRFRQSRGQQGIGISAAGMFGQLTTGKPVAITSKIGKGKPAHYFEIQIDTRKNQPEVIKDEVVAWEPDHGTAVEIELEGTYKKGRRSVDDYVEQTALANPHAAIVYRPPRSEEIRYERVASELPREALEIKPHPHGVELGALMQMMKETKARNLRSAFQQDFSRVSGRVADQIAAAAGLEPSRAPHKLLPHDVEKLYRAVQKTKIMAPPTNCLSPIGADLIFKGLAQRVQADFVTSSTRPPSVYRGHPFQVEVGLAYGGSLPADELIEVYRFANRVPLQYQQSACAITKAVVTTDWHNYQLSQSKGAPPAGPMVLFVHIASVWVPFTSESKEAVAHYPEIIKELRLALQECGRRLGIHLRHHRREQDELKKRSYIEKYLPAIGSALRDILSLTAGQVDVTVANLKDVLEKSRKL